MKPITLDELHSILLDIAKEFHRICVEHNIPYYMLGGTMLGAVRHKGFIPWDDDMDFGVPREHFEQLKRVLEEELPSHYRVLTMDNSDALVENFIKIEDRRTVVYEKYKENVQDKFGVNIDVFPIDECNYRKGLFSKNYWISILVKVQIFRFLYAKNMPLIKKMIAYTIKGSLFFLKERSIINFIEKYLVTKGDCYNNYYGAWGSREIVPNSFFGKGKLYDFEDYQFYGLDNSSAYLTNLYGDYMKLPPKEKQRSHLMGVFWKST